MFYGMPCPWLAYKAAEEAMEDMYPKAYYKIYPTVYRICNEMDDPIRYPVPDRKIIKKMTRRIYDEVEGSMGEFSRYHRHSYYNEDENSFDIHNFGSGELLETLVAVILIQELLGRRRKRFLR